MVDLNLTFFNHPLWTNFRENIIQLGYFKRDISSFLYLSLIALIGFIHFLLIKNEGINPVKIAIVISIITLFAYPFLSRDLFNYMFDAKILTYYQQNPYLHKALDFPNDHWLRFMHWTHRSYPYGPVWLGISIIPSFFAIGKFILNFIFFKLMFAFFYLLGVYVLNKMNKTWALFFATNPLIIVEGLISSHNDLVALSLTIFGIYFIFNKKNNFGRFFLILSAGIKYITLPILFISKSNKKINYLVFLTMIIILSFLSLKLEIQPWYFLSLLAFIPLKFQLISQLNIFFLGLLFSYYPYIRFGGWDKIENINLKHQIIICFLVINILFILIKKINFKKNIKKN